MRIISKFRDYYDSVLAYGGAADNHLMYKRLVEEIEKYDIRDKEILKKLVKRGFDKNRYDHMSRNPGHNYTMRTFIIGFCGKIYPLVVLETGDRFSFHATDHRIAFAYNEADVSVFMKKDKKLYDSYLNKRSQWDSKTHHSLQEKFIKFFDDLSGSEILSDLFFELNTPIFMIDIRDSQAYDHESYMKLIINPILKDHKFMKVMDTYTAYQEIEMYLGGGFGY